MSITIQEYAQALHLAVQESKTEEYDTVIQNLIDVLKSNGDLDKYEAIVSEFEVLVQDQEEVTQAEAVFARQATESKAVLDELNSVLGPQVEVRSKVDNELVGGVVVRVDDTLIDASVKSQLERMKKDLSE